MPRIASLLPLILLCGLCASCATGRWKKDAEVERSSRVLVELESWSGEEGGDSAGFDHPASIEAEQLSAVLGPLRYRSSARSSQIAGPVVAPDLVDPLAAALARGLQRAGRRQRVRFAVLNPTRMLFVPASKLSRGTAFVAADGTLNLAFDQVDANKAEFEFGEWANPTFRSESRAQLVAVAGARLHTESDGEVRDSWLEVPREAWARAVVQAGSEAGTETKTAGTEAEAPGEGEGARPGIAAIEPDAERAVRLRFLEELYAEGLIAERAYLQKRQELDDG